MRSETHLEDLALALSGLVEQFRLKAMTQVSPTEWPAWRLLIFLTDHLLADQSEMAHEIRQQLSSDLLSSRLVPSSERRQFPSDPMVTCASAHWCSAFTKGRP